MNIRYQRYIGALLKLIFARDVNKATLYPENTLRKMFDDPGLWRDSAHSDWMNYESSDKFYRAIYRELDKKFQTRPNYNETITEDALFRTVKSKRYHGWYKIAHVNVAKPPKTYVKYIAAAIFSDHPQKAKKPIQEKSLPYDEDGLLDIFYDPKIRDRAFDLLRASAYTTVTKKYVELFETILRKGPVSNVWNVMSRQMYVYSRASRTCSEEVAQSKTSSKKMKGMSWEPLRLGFA